MFRILVAALIAIFLIPVTPSRAQVRQDCPLGPDGTLYRIRVDEIGLLERPTQSPGDSAAVAESLSCLVHNLYDALRVQEAGAIVLVFVHGWKHSADSSDSNYCCFQKILKSVADIERQKAANEANYKRKTVLGLYLGWPAKEPLPPFASERLQNLSFWRIKKRADVISHGHILKILSILDNIHKRHRNMQLVTIGHSFGARIVFETVSSVLASRVMEALTVDGLGQKVDGLYRDLELQTNSRDVTVGAPVKGFGDLVLLLNPAFEASRYRVLSDLRRTGQIFQPGQRPLMLIVSTDNDTATRQMWPLSYVFEPLPRDERAAILTRTTIGNYEPFHTHKLEQCVATETAEAAECSCGSDSAQPTISASSSCFGNAQLVPRPGDAASRNPFIVASTNDKIINEHNGIFSRAFVSFMLSYLASNLPQ